MNGILIILSIIGITLLAIADDWPEERRMKLGFVLLLLVMLGFFAKPF